MDEKRVNLPVSFLDSWVDDPEGSVLIDSERDARMTACIQCPFLKDEMCSHGDCGFKGVKVAEATYRRVSVCPIKRW